MLNIADFDHRRREIEQKRNDLVEAHLCIVEPIAAHLMQAMPPCYTIDDLRAEGRLALMAAAMRYRDDGGASFRTYAKHAVRGAMLELIRRKTLRDNTVPGFDDARALVQIPAGLDESIDRERRRHRLSEAVARLDSREQRVILLYYVDPEQPSLAEVAERMGLSTARVAQIRNAGLKRLRELLADEPELLAS